LDPITSGEALCAAADDSTSHLKQIPQPRLLRDQIRERVRQAVAKLDVSRVPGRAEIESIARKTLTDLSQPEAFLGWTMVVGASAFWRPQVASIRPERRLLVLPKPAPECAAGRSAGQALKGLQDLAQRFGLKAVSVQSAQEVVGLVLRGEADAILGIAALDDLEKVFERVLRLGIPCMAVPLLGTDLAASADLDWVTEMVGLSYAGESPRTPSYFPLMRFASAMFAPDELHRLAQRTRPARSLAGVSPAELAPLTGTEQIAFDFLSKGGKHSRPFITLAVYDALTGGQATSASATEHLQQLPDAIRRAAMCIETFHKASLVHDDIEDDDVYRYGVPTIHRQFGTPTAINVGDYLIGLGYRLVTREAAFHSPQVAADILDALADAHLQLTQGQGAELLWRDAQNKMLTVSDALDIYALKTSPAFAAALLVGLRMASPWLEYREPLCQFARHLGVAFQILNDLGDWLGDNNNKLLAAGDVVGGRPTVLWALALEGLHGAEREELLKLAAEVPATSATVDRIRQLYQSAGVFQKAERLVNEYESQASALAKGLQPQPLQNLLLYLVDSVLETRPRAA
jgi:geranylgeranyl pyrophosphate synthase